MGMEPSSVETPGALQLPVINLYGKRAEAQFRMTK